MREQAIAAAYESARSRMVLSPDDFAAAMADWQVYPVLVDGVLVGAILVNGEEIHACIKPEGFGRWFSRGLMKRTLLDVIAKHGRAVTRVESGNEKGRKFVESLGFRKTTEARGICWYEVKNGS